jgi:uncharacterized protein YndB with AHSA1/START domain
VSAVIVSLRIEASPQAVFEAFTKEIALWWRPSPLFQLTPHGDGRLRFEGEEGGRLVTTLPSGKVFLIGRITAWRAPKALAFTWRHASFAADQQTHVEVAFEPIGETTRVTITHRGWDEISQHHAARHGFPLAATQLRQSEQWRAALRALAELI